MDVTKTLMDFGLTRQESVIYINLLSEGAMTGYEVAKLTGISRSNTYTTLAGLVDKGAAYTEDGSPTRYTAVGAEEFCSNKLKYLWSAKEELAANLPAKRTDSDGYMTIKGIRNIHDKIFQMLSQVKYRVYMSGTGNVIRPFMDDLCAMAQKGLKVVIITDVAIAVEKAVVYHADRAPGQIGVIADSQVVLTGDVGNEENATCLYTGRKNLIDVFKNSLKNEIRIIELTKGVQNNEKSTVCDERTD